MAAKRKASLSVVAIGLIVATCLAAAGTIFRVSTILQRTGSGPRSQVFTERQVAAAELGGARRTLLSKTEAAVATLSAPVTPYAGCNLTVATPTAPAHGGVLAEPHKETLFELSLSCQPGTDPADVVLLSNSPEGQQAVGTQFRFTYTVPGASELLVYACLAAKAGETGCSPETSEQVFRQPVAVTHVRRELRSLSLEDRQRYFAAVKTLQKHSTAQGQMLYGAKFRSYGELAARHMAVSWGFYGQCNMGHNGPAFIPFHRAFAREFELAIQSVDPSVASHYWDYISDAELAYPADSAIWSDDFYGGMVGDAEDNYIVKNGQFAYWKIPNGEEAQALSQLAWGGLGPIGVVNPYGYLRSPEVNNPAPYTTRMGNVLGESLPKRSAWAECTKEAYLGSVISCIEKFVHVSAHDIIGGLRGLPTFADVQSSLNCSQFSTVAECAKAFEEYKVYGIAVRSLMVRDGCMVCDKLCANITDDPATCSCECISPAPLRCSAHFVMMKFFSREEIPLGSEFAGYGLCTPSAYVGDYADVAASVNDPIFWPHHTNVDRVFVSWRNLYPEGQWEDLNFTYPSTNNSVYPDYFSEVNILNPDASWPGVIPPGDGNPTGVCEGHGLWDATLRGTFFDMFRSLNQSQPHTNLELLQTVDTQISSPLNADYIYDKYEMF